MKTKLFLSFLAVILIALISNLIFSSLIQSDFDDYVMGSREDQLYWLLAALEGSHDGNKWDKHMLNETIHWGVMLGFDVQVLDMNGVEVSSSGTVLKGLDPNMRRRMGSIIDVSSPKGDPETYPLFVSGDQIGSMRVRELMRLGNVAEKERMLKKRGMEFLLFSFIIAGGGALFLSMVFSIFLTNPIMKLKDAAVQIAGGEFGVRVDYSSGGEIGKLARSFNFMSEALKMEDMIRKRLTANIAHELRTPLTIMKANLEGMSDGVVSMNAEQVRNLSEEVERLIGLVEGIEDSTRAEAAFLRKNKMEKVDVDELILKNLKSVEKIAEKKKVELRNKTDGPLVVITDREKLNSIMKNLITNSLKFTDSGEVKIEAKKDGGYLVFKITDTGKGIAKADIGRIFDRYFMGDGSAGTGIGLSIVKELVTALEGDVNVLSEPGRGSVFTVTIPEGETEG